MANSIEMLSFLDLLDLDEELIDNRLKSIMDRSNHSNKQLLDALQLIQYKNIVNLQDKTDCENSEEFDFVVKLIKNIHPDVIENVCKITISVLRLNSSTLVSNSQHLVQQLLSNIEFSRSKPKSGDDADQSKTLLYFKVCDSVLDAVIQGGLKIDLLFMEVPLEQAICHNDEKVKFHFITSTVPKLFKAINGYNILDSVWNYLKELRDIEVALKVLSCLSDYYLPAVDVKGNIQFESEVVYHYEFWRITLFGLMSSDFTHRKISVYLTKRALDYLASKQINIFIKSENNLIFSWDHKMADVLRKEWDSFFIMIDSLEEKQSNIVLPSLQLFDAINEIPNCWVHCAFNLGLKHDNSQVRLKCAEHQLKRKVISVTEAIVLLKALDDINFYENVYDLNILKGKVTEMLRDRKSLVHILEAIPQANLSPVPLFHMTDILAELDVKVLLNDKNASEILTELMKASCNILALRKAVIINISHFVGKCCKGLDWRVFAKVFSLLQLECKEMENTDNPLVTLLEDNLTSNEGDTRELYKLVTNTLVDIDFGLFYLEKHPKDMNLFIEIINDKIQHIKNVVSRQYSNKLEFLNDVMIVLRIFSKCKEEKSPVKEFITNVIMKELNTLLHYILCLLTSDAVLTVDENKSLFNCLKCLDNIVNKDSKDIFIQLYKSSVILLNDSNIELEKAALSMFVINYLSDDKTFVTNFKHEMLDLKDLLNLIKIFKNKGIHKAQSIGKLKNIFYEKHSETVNIILEDQDLKLDRYLNSIVDYLDDIIECGGYGCLYWILKIINKIVKLLSLAKDIIFDINQFINRMWRELEELKTNNHDYSPCMEEFANLITHDALLEKPEFNNTVILYCNKILQYGSIKSNPLYYLARELNRKEVNRHGHLVYVLGELLLYCPVSRKDQRITDNLEVDILRNKKYGVNSDDIDLHFNFEIKYESVSMLSRINDSETLNIIASFITNKIDDIFKHKVRYHGNSQIHRTIQTGLQHLVFIQLLNSNVDSKRILNWCLHLLGRLPHQQSVRICLEWFITLCFYNERRPIDKQMSDLLKYKKVPVPSQFIIMYWLLKHKIDDNTWSTSEYEFVLDTLISHTMGQLFNIRLHAQYLSTKLHDLYRHSKGKYDYTIEVINRTLTENSKDKNLAKLREDYFVNEFDAIGNLTPYFLYNSLPKLCDSNNNEIDNLEFVTQVTKKINKFISSNVDNEFKKEWARCYVEDEEMLKIELSKHPESKEVEELEKMGNLQKKYVPWKNMSDVNVYETTKKRENLSDLIVVASLIDKLPNLGGMARTSEVFGVKTYVIDSLRHLQDKQFQGLSVSAERWIDIEEIRPGQPLKDYLNGKKAEGYAVVAAEQTSTGSKLQTFKFPRKTLLLLGHEKEGIPCDLLPMMDHCVEIPQQGFVRSLNVHVTAAIFVWEYVRQNVL